MTQTRLVNGFHHAALKVANFEAVVAFYQTGLGLTERISWGEANNRAVLLDTGNGNYLEVFAGGDGAKPQGGVLHLAFRTADCDAALAQAVAAGADGVIDKLRPYAGQVTRWFVSQVGTVKVASPS